MRPKLREGLLEKSMEEGIQEPLVVTRLCSASRPANVMLTIIAIVMLCCWCVYHIQYQVLPEPQTAEEAGKQGFSEIEAMKHVRTLFDLGPHLVGNHALDVAIQYVERVAEEIKRTSDSEVEVEVDNFHAKPGANRLNGEFFGKTQLYADLNYIVVRITPKNDSLAKINSILVSSHIDTVFSTGGAGDASSCVGVMLELARGLSHWAQDFKSSVIFLFNTGEEEGLNGAHSFITQHPWRETVRVAVDLEAMGIGGKSGLFQIGTDSWSVENFARVAKYPTGNVMTEDLFAAGLVNSATDFQVYQELAGLSGLDFAFTDKTAVYHTKNDKPENIQPGSLQHLGENMLAFLIQVSSSSDLPKGNTSRAPEYTDGDSAVYFDILGMYMIVYSQQFANMLNNYVILLSLSIWITSLFMGGYRAMFSFALSFTSVILMWVFSLSFSILVAFFLSSTSVAPAPYIGNPWLVIGLFGAPSLVGAFSGQHLGFRLLQKYLTSAYAKRQPTLSHSDQVKLAGLEAERWLFKSGTLQWLLLLVLLHYYKAGSSFIPLVWLVTPAFSYWLLEATLSPLGLPKPLKPATLLIALSVPLVISIGVIIRIIGVFIGTIIRFDGNPGGSSEWMGNVIVSAMVAAVVCLTLVYLLSYIHLSGAKTAIILMSCVLFSFSVNALWSGALPSYTEEISRTLNVVHVVDTTRNYGDAKDVSSYVSLFSFTPGNLDREIESMKEGFECGTGKPIDFVSFSVKYGCVTYNETRSGWNDLDIPLIEVKSDNKISDVRVTEIFIDTKASKRWAMNINSDEVTSFAIKAAGESEEILPLVEMTSVGGWHLLRFAGGKNSPTKFDLTLHRHNTSLHTSRILDEEEDSERYLIKLRTDVTSSTPKAQSVLIKLPSWSAVFGKSTAPFQLAFLTALPVDYSQKSSTMDM